MESDVAATRDKRKADTISTQEDPNQENPNKRKRHSNSSFDETATSTNDEDEQNSPTSDEEKEGENISDDTEYSLQEEDYDDHSDQSESTFYGDFEDGDEDLGPEEREVELREDTLGNQKLTFKIFLLDGDDEFIDWMQTMHVCCSHEGKQIGRGFGRYVKRNQIRHRFWASMEEPCRELSEIAFDLFDRYGRLRKEFKDHSVRRGTGAWGSELDLESFFVIEDLLVDRNWRHKGIGTKIVNHLIEKSQTDSRKSKFSLVIPGWLRRDLEPDIRGKNEAEQREIRARAFDAAVSFFRSLGFRRVGASDSFGLAKDTSHPAYAILPTDDFDPAQELPDIDQGPEDEDVADWNAIQGRKSWQLELLKDRLPLHHAAIALPDSESVEFFRDWKASENSADEWTKIDRYSNNVLHVAACELKVQAVRWLMNDSTQGEILRVARNVKGYTPIEELETNLETKRTRLDRGMMTVDISDNFSGFSPEAVNCLTALRSKTDPSPVQCAQLKFGCTCGLCIDGFLSPRMKFALLCQAETTHDMLNMDIGDGQTWCMWHDLTHVVLDIQRNFATNKSYRQGFSNIFDHAATTLRNNKTPTTLNVLNEYENASEWPPHTSNFLRRGGKPESALRTIFESARDQDEWAGDGDHMETFEGEINALPECRNDHEFGFVALMCGIPNLTPLYG